MGRPHGARNSWSPPTLASPLNPTQGPNASLLKGKLSWSTCLPCLALGILVSESCTGQGFYLQFRNQNLGGVRSARDGKRASRGCPPACCWPGPALPRAALRSRLLGFPLCGKAPASMSCFQPFPVPKREEASLHRKNFYFESVPPFRLRLVLGAGRSGQPGPTCSPLAQALPSDGGSWVGVSQEGLLQPLFEDTAVAGWVGGIC